MGGCNLPPHEPKSLADKREALFRKAKDYLLRCAGQSSATYRKKPSLPSCTRSPSVLLNHKE